MTKYFYVRVSSEEQKKKGLSVQAQIDLAKSIGIDESNIYVDSGRSASLLDEDIRIYHINEEYTIKIKLSKRPEFNKLITLLKENDDLYIKDWDRLTRNILFYEAFKHQCKVKGIQLISVQQSNDTLTVRLLIVIAQTETEKTTIRNNDIQESLFNKGLHPFRSPFGYIKNIKESNGKLRFPNELEGMLVINEKEAEIVRKIYALKKVKTVREISEELKLHKQTIWNIIRNPIYCGYISYKNEKKKGLHKPIVSEELFFS